MGFLRRLADRFDAPRETRADPSWEALASGAADWTAIKSGVTPTALTPRLAENFATVSACVAAIAGALGSLPAFVYRLSKDGRAVDQAHAVARLIRDGANARQSWPEFLEWWVAQALLFGNGLAEIVADPRSGA
ncbi:MAG: phage portal protein, partial [Parvularculaceae bacterium]